MIQIAFIIIPVLFSVFIDGQLYRLSMSTRLQGGNIRAAAIIALCFVIYFIKIEFNKRNCSFSAYLRTAAFLLNILLVIWSVLRSTINNHFVFLFIFLLLSVIYWHYMSKFLLKFPSSEDC